jgi:hypothetical protein
MEYILDVYFIAAIIFPILSKNYKLLKFTSTQDLWKFLQSTAHDSIYYIFIIKLL